MSGEFCDHLGIRPTLRIRGRVRDNVI